MMRWIVRSSLRLRRLVVVAALGIMVLGIVQLGKTPVDVLPEFSPVQVEVQTEALGLSAAEVEQLVTVPLEQDLLNGIAFLDEIESTSLPGLSSVVMTFERGTDLLNARQVVAERLTQAVAVGGLPQVAKAPQMLQPLSSTSRVMMIRLSPDSSGSISPIEVSVLARWVIVPRLLGVDGVANVSIWGQRDRQLQVQVDPGSLHRNGVSLAEVIATTGNALEVSPLTFLEASSPGTGGFIENLNQRIQVFHEQTINTADELAQVPIEDSEGRGVLKGGRALTLGEVATVVEDHQPLIGDALCQEGECILLVVEKFPDANTVAVSSNIDAALEAMQPGLKGIQFDTSVYRPAEFTQFAFANLARTLAIGIVLALFVIVAFLRGWRTILIAIVALAASVATGLLVLRAGGATVNLMVMTGFIAALGALIADAVSDAGTLATRIRRERRERPDSSVWGPLIEASLEMRRASLSAALVVAAAMIPFAFMAGEGGAFLPPIARSYLLAIAASMVVALVITPALSLTVLGRVPGAPEARDGLARLYDHLATRSLRRTGWGVAAAGIVLVAGLASVPFMKSSLPPSLGERDVLVNVESEPGTSLPRMREIVAEAVEKLSALPGVRKATAHVGRAILSDQRVNVNSGAIWVSLDGDADRATLSGIESVMDRYAGIDDTVRTYVEQRVSEVLDTQSEDIVVRVYGENAAVRQAKAEEIRRVIAGVEGVDEPEIKQQRVEQTVEVEVNLEKAQAVGLKPGDVRRTATVLISGLTVGNLFDEQKVFDVVVWGEPGVRRSVDDLRNLQIETPSGTMVRLADIADVRLASNPTAIKHESVANYVDVTAGVRGRSIIAVTADVQEAVRSVDFPIEHHAEVLGGYAELRGTRGRVLAGALAGVVAIFLILQAAFASWRLAVLAFATLPVAVAGGLLAILASGRAITLGALAALLTVLGITARHAVTLVRRYQELERREGADFGPDLVVRGTQDRLPAILATTLGTSLLLLPFAFSGGAGLELIRPMAITALGGLVTSAFASLVLIPALYLRFGFVGQPETSEEDLFVVAVPPLEPPAESPGGAA